MHWLIYRNSFFKVLERVQKIIHLYFFLFFFRENIKPLIEFGLAEASHSVAFSLHASGTLLTGMNNKHIKIFDLRGKWRFPHLLHYRWRFVHTKKYALIHLFVLCFVLFIYLLYFFIMCIELKMAIKVKQDNIFGCNLCTSVHNLYNFGIFHFFPLDILKCSYVFRN